MQDLGRIIEISGGSAKVAVQPHAACGGCALEGKCAADASERLFWADNPQNGRVGEQVLIEVKPQAKILGSAVIFLLPIAGLFLGYLLGFVFGRSTDYGVIGATVGVAAFIILVRLIDKFLARKSSLKPVITHILS